MCVRGRKRRRSGWFVGALEMASFYRVRFHMFDQYNGRSKHAYSITLLYGPGHLFPS